MNKKWSVIHSSSAFVAPRVLLMMDIKPLYSRRQNLMAASTNSIASRPWNLIRAAAQSWRRPCWGGAKRREGWRVDTWGGGWGDTTWRAGEEVGWNWSRSTQGGRCGCGAWIYEGPCCCTHTDNGMVESSSRLPISEWCGQFRWKTVQHPPMYALYFIL